MNFPSFQNVSLEQFSRCVSQVFRIPWGEEASTPVEFVQAMEKIPYNSGFGGASFGLVPTPGGEWGYVYATISDRFLVWLPGNELHCLNMEESCEFRGRLEEILGIRAVNNQKPSWLEESLTLAIWSYRPTEEELPDSSGNDYFFQLMSQKVFDVIKDYSFGEPLNS